MRIRAESFRSVSATAVSEILLGIAAFFLILAVLFPPGPSSLHSPFLIALIASIVIPSLAYLGFLLTSPTHKHVGEGLRPVVASIILVLSALPGGIFGYYLIHGGVGWGALFFLSPLLFLVPAAVVIYFRRRKARELLSPSGKRGSGLTGGALFSAYVISLSGYISMIAIGGTALSDVEKAFVNNLGMHVVFWFLLPVNSAALLAYTLVCRKHATSHQAEIVRVALCAIVVFLSYSAMLFVTGRMYGT